MKKIFTLLFVCSLLIQAHAQTANAVVYSEMGEKFTLYLNSEAQNDQAMSNVKIKGLTADYYQARIDFEDPTLADFANSNFAVQKGMEVTYIVKKNKKGEYVLRYHGEASIGGAVSAPSAEPAISDEVVRITEVEEEAVEAVPSDMNIDMNIAVPEEEVVQVTTTTTTTNGSGKPAPKPAATKTTTTNTENVSMGINVGGVNMGVSIKVDESNMDMDMGVDVEESSSTTKTTTTTTKTTTTSKPAPAKQPATKPATKPDVVVVESVAGCSKAMAATDFAGAKTSISSKGFEDQKLSTAKMITKANCLTAAQIKEICGLFGFEETKLTFAKHAYDFCTDKGNYYVVNDVFNFSESTEELEQFISSK
jgi:hypothetical protein